jgi:O-acetyl-ADP-ribose deacetylase (regulator of RNase III)|uniref:Macro domain-containing protein n=1 Tax=Mesoaciditoga lauensis TaxID=1495039 RepID=A0A7V3RF72_9BACT
MISYSWEENGVREVEIEKTKVEIESCDITTEKVDVIVNAANSHLAHGGGVALAISKAAGSILNVESSEYVKKHGPVKTGYVALTSGGNLFAKHVIHAVGPVWGEKDEDLKLSMAFYNSLKKADEIGAKSISFPAISSGIYGFPKERCAKIFYETIKRYFSNENSRIVLVRICLYSKADLMIFEKVFDETNF